MDKAICPVCGHEESVKLYPEYTGPCVTSQLDFLAQCTLDNRCCAACGFIFNAAGVRGRTKLVYTQQNWKPKPQVLSFADGVKSQQERALEVFDGLLPVPETGRILDFGAGRGYFLEYFSRRHPDGWEMYAIEPGGGQAEHARRIPGAVSFGRPYYEVTLPHKMDCIVVMSVLEHLEDPLAALRWIVGQLADDGIVYMQHPDFEHLPGDLFCADHIGKLTPAYLEALCGHAGLKVVADRTGGVMFSFACKPAPPRPLGTDAGPSLDIAHSAERTARASVACVKKALDTAAGHGGEAAIFGTSPVGSMAPYMLGCPNAIRWFVDENQNVWGRQIGNGIVIGPERMAECGITDVALAISPNYWDTVSQKLSAYAVRVHCPQP